MCVPLTSAAPVFVTFIVTCAFCSILVLFGVTPNHLIPRESGFKDGADLPGTIRRVK